MSELIPELTVTSVSQLTRIAEEYGETFDLLYRGQSDQFKSLTTSLERHYKTQEEIDRSTSVPGKLLTGSHNWLASREAQNLRAFQVRARHFISDLPARDDYVEWFALMQHHGAPTRMLDVTKSLFVALYFAVSHSSEHDGIVHAFFSPSALTNSSSAYSDTKLGSIFSRERVHFEPDAHNNETANAVIELDGNLRAPLASQAKPPANQGLGIVVYQSIRPSRREIAQQGLFLIPSSASQTFETIQQQVSAKLVSYFETSRDGGQLGAYKPTSIEQLNYYHHKTNPRIRFRIPRDKFRSIRLTLKHMNITTDALFPDFEGLGRFIHDETTWGKEIYGR